ncbi:hypothetical protein GCM10010112_83730 [Actinoplanes lobatus]|uniref:Uncharacterized protein n=1 Tax=Actinoplanes lobatus TaxID=113568 RepID=A0A7W7MJ94_9ACTN|nr:hypothetical protein [Actinoplanes lobatus]MBB4752329.1 hypothetical protein [Actinoplanes lobatus]GGN94411.1 hypothetical protein GCM10010112_83730 [Actinoplanes lobatus]GIE46015.1 hypothetical protein Alo02nite_89130 [Actinoplanes lobatus]
MLESADRPDTAGLVLAAGRCTPLLRLVKAVVGSLEGVLVVVDALHAQVGHAADGAHLMVAVKANQRTLFDQVKGLPWSRIPIGAQTREPGHGRKETRPVKRSPLQPRAGWDSPTRNRPSGSPAPARSRARPAAKRHT